MLEGLEVSIIKMSELNLINDRFRFDAEYTKKEYLIIEEKLKSINFKRLIDTDTKIIHPSEIKRKYVENGEWFFRTQNLRPLKIENSNDVFISKEDANKLAKNEIKYGDVLITRTGANYGQTAIYNIKNKAIGSSHVFILRNSFFNQSYLAVFLNTKYGVKMIDKGMYGAAQPEIAPYYLLNIPIPDFNISFQEKIEELIKLSEKATTQSQQTYTQAENLLLETLGLKDFKPSVEKVNIKNFKDSFLTTGRLDAEYYQPKYEKVVEKIKENNYARLADLVNIKKSIEPGSNAYSDEGLPFLRVADYNKFGTTEPNKCLSDSYVKENTIKLSELKPKEETIIFSKDGSVGTAYMLKENKNLITSGAILHLTVKNKEQVLPEYLTLALNSQLVQMQAERDAGGSIILHWRVGEIENVIIPIIDLKTQQQISDKIEESFRLKKQSEQLLELAKTAVEKAIEEDKEAAIEYINNSKLSIANE